MTQLLQVINELTSGFEARALPTTNGTARVDNQLLQFACIDLISQLENRLSKAMSMSRVFFVDESATIAQNSLILLRKFCDENFDIGKESPVYGQIAQGLAACDGFEEVLKTRTLGNAILRTFWKANENGAIQASHQHLGQSLARACAATFYQAIMLLGGDTEAGKLVDESASVFVTELKQSW